MTYQSNGSIVHVDELAWKWDVINAECNTVEAELSSNVKTTLLHVHGDQLHCSNTPETATILTYMYRRSNSLPNTAVCHRTLIFSDGYKDHYTYNHFTAFVQDYPGELVPEVTFTHSHLSWSSTILHLLPPSTTIHGVLLVQFTCNQIHLPQYTLRTDRPTNRQTNCQMIRHISQLHLPNREWCS